MLETTPKITAVEFEALNLPGVHELVHGEIVAVSGGTPYNSELTLWLAFYIKLYLREHNIGRLTGADASFVLAPDTVRIPDLAFTSFARALTLLDHVGGIIPHLAIEVISPGNSAEEISLKTEDYLAAGVQIVWNIYPKVGRADIFRAMARS